MSEWWSAGGWCAGRPGGRVQLCRSALAGRGRPEARSASCRLSETALYTVETRLCRRSGADYLLFSSAQGVRDYFAAGGDPSGAVCVSIGPVTSAALRSLVSGEILEAEEISARGLLAAVLRPRCRASVPGRPAFVLRVRRACAGGRGIRAFAVRVGGRRGDGYGALCRGGCPRRALRFGMRALSASPSWMGFRIRPPKRRRAAARCELEFGRRRPSGPFARAEVVERDQRRGASRPTRRAAAARRRARRRGRDRVWGDRGRGARRQGAKEGGQDLRRGSAYGGCRREGLGGGRAGGA